MVKILSMCLVSVALMACHPKNKDCSQCNDPAALNYQAGASSDISCCVYQPVKPQLKTTLASQVSSTSGLVFSDGRLWTHNDSGGANEIYALDTTSGQVIQTVVLEGATNVDYEDITKSPLHLYVGDMGNNDGDRRNLRIYRFPRTALNASDPVIHTPVETIEFSYPDQTDFTKRKDHNFDCEAILYWQENLYLFTKNRLDLQCNLYVIPAMPGSYQAQRLGSFDSRGLVTGAEISESGNQVLLVGYNKTLNVFLWELSGFNGNEFLMGRKKRVDLGAFSEVGQVEGICFTDKNTLYLSSEQVLNLPPRLYRLVFSALK